MSRARRAIQPLVTTDPYWRLVERRRAIKQEIQLCKMQIAELEAILAEIDAELLANTQGGSV